MVLVGVYFNESLNFLGFPDLLYILISVVLMIMLWLSTVLVNNVYDLPIDRISNPRRPLPKGEVKPSEYLDFSFVLSTIAIIVSLVLGIIPFIIVVISVLSSAAYSAPPLRLRKRLFSTVFIGWGSLLTFFVGYFAYTSVFNISVQSETLLVALIIFVAFSIGPLTKDLKDYKGDLEHGVKTLFTVYGLQKGKLMVSILLGFSLLMPLFLFHGGIDIVFLGSMAVLTSLLFYRKEDVIFSFAGYGIVFFYCIVRIVGYI
jgi:chlorophyll synthase